MDKKCLCQKDFDKYSIAANWYKLQVSNFTLTYKSHMHIYVEFDNIGLIERKKKKKKVCVNVFHECLTYSDLWLCRKHIFGTRVRYCWGVSFYIRIHVCRIDQFQFLICNKRYPLKITALPVYVSVLVVTSHHGHFR